MFSIIFLLITSFTYIHAGIQEENKVSHRPQNVTARRFPSDCKCVPLNSCNDFSDRNIDQRIDITMYNDGPCDDYMDVCCKNPTDHGNRISPGPSERSGCGQRNPEGVGFTIVGSRGDVTQFGEFPWMVAIHRNKNGIMVFHCGGALIHPEIVLTAAHCFPKSAKPSTFRVRAGEWDTRTQKEMYAHQDIIVKNVVIHPQYYAGGLYNDIALLFLEDSFELADHVDVICLPEENEEYDINKCFASGWGSNKFTEEGVHQMVLQKIELPIVESTQCQQLMRKTRLGPRFSLHQSFLCAGGEKGKDTCSGDGGSPLVCPAKSDGRYVQLGVVSWGIGCGQQNVPGIYANVAVFRDWINDESQNYGIELNY